MYMTRKIICVYTAFAVAVLEWLVFRYYVLVLARRRLSVVFPHGGKALAWPLSSCMVWYLAIDFVAVIFSTIPVSWIERLLSRCSSFGVFLKKGAQQLD